MSDDDDEIEIWEVASLVLISAWAAWLTFTVIGILRSGGL